jgi:hypothetical protein
MVKGEYVKLFPRLPFESFLVLSYFVTVMSREVEL